MLHCLVLCTVQSSCVVYQGTHQALVSAAHCAWNKLVTMQDHARPHQQISYLQTASGKAAKDFAHIHAASAKAAVFQHKCSPADKAAGVGAGRFETCVP